MLCKDCGESEIEKNGRCLECFRAVRTRQAADRRSRLRAELAAKNETLELEGKRVCGKCVKVRVLTEFGTSLGDGLGKRNKLCDRCLCEMYATRGDGFDYRFWRARAYSLNTVARSRASREMRCRVDLADLPFVFKPQHLLEMYEEQDGKCWYCRIELERGSTSVDHLHPLSAGGVHELGNVRLTCRDCNNLKSDRTEDEFRKFVVGYVKRFRK